jgi:hypothetical protein
MPTYTFRNKETGDQFEKMMKISELDSFREQNPQLETVIQSPMICDPVRVGARKMDTGFKEVLQKVHEQTPGSKLNKISSQL